MYNYYDVVIVGAGPAGLTAALYLLRGGKTVALFEKESIGGQMSKAPYIENYPGVVGSGDKLATKMFEQVSRYDVEVFIEEVDNIYRENDLYITETDFGTRVKSKDLIIATGGKPIVPSILGVDRPNVHYCATCDGALYEDKEVVVIGDGNSALQYARELADICEKVHVCALGDRLYGEQSWIDRVVGNPFIEVHYNFETVEISKCGVCAGNGEHIFADGVFIAIGYEPNLPPLKGINILTNEKGYVVSPDGSTPEGIYCIGDVRTKPFRQIASAVNDGMTAALSILRKNN